MPEPIQDFSLPQVPTNPTFEGVMGMLKGRRPLQTGILPQVQGILGQQSQLLQGPIAQMQEQGNVNVANLQSMMGQRGLTGSSIEAQGLGNVMSGTQRNIGELTGGFAARGANQFADLMMRANTGDVEASRQMQILLAQAMGQELTAGRDMQMFQQQLRAMMDQAGANRRASMWGAGIGAVGQIGSGMAQGGTGFFSDSRLKTNIQTKHEGAFLGGKVREVSFEWSKEARKMGAPVGSWLGVLADEVKAVAPKLVGEDRGYMTVDYGRL